MYRFLLTPRWLSGTALAVAAVAVCVWLGTWQLGRFEDKVSSHQEISRTVDDAGSARPLGELLGADRPQVTTDTVGRAVTVSGTFDQEHQLLVPNRVLDGKQGYYVLTPLRTGDGRTVAVVRGWAPGAPAEGAAAEGVAAAAPAGEVTVTGRLQAGESSGSNGAVAGGLPAGQLGTINQAALVNKLSYEGWYDGWVSADAAPAGLTPVPTVQPQGGDGLTLRAFQNLGYTLEWFVFGGFVVFMWFRLVRREAEAEQDRALGLDPVLE
ncbi:SURF1 family protein [Kitasatospora sp. RG8]|uniref:SURF1 family protein n=1 Tax=Kitasatospora sp. RG8 TaxID=2820815 RepID=UPI001ADF53EA|nr:SURF1 family protein [Kitasatospora sp. RG8]MBP0455511.1 SURF1 family protein [Kitasatospora sp. RG8]